MKKKLAIIRADEGQLPLVNKAKEMGVEIHCFSWDKKGYTYCKDIVDYFHPISILDKEKILEKCREIKIDGVISKADNAMPTVAFVAQNMGLPGNGYEDALVLCNKYTARLAFHKHGVNSPLFARASDGADLTGFKYPLIVKPVDGKATAGVTKVLKPEDLQSAITRALDESFMKEAIIEEFIDGFEASVDTVSCNGKHHILSIKEREMGNGVYGSVKIAGHCPTDLAPEIITKIKSETQKALDAVNFKNGASNTEFLVTKEGEVYIIELNPRLTGNKAYTIMQLHNGYDFAKGAIDIALGQFEEPVFAEIKYAGIYLLTKQTEWVRQIIENRENDPDIIYADIFDDETPELQYLGDNVGYFIYQSNRRRRWGPK